MDRRLLSLAVISALVVASGTAQAGGLYLQEYATPSQGAAGAGANALGTDASTAFHNPAGMTRLDDHALLGGGGLLITDVQFDKSGSTPNTGGNGGNQGGLGPILSAHYVHVISDRIRFGASLVSVSGAVLDPSNGWAGRFEVQKVSFITLSAMPSIAVEVVEGFSLAASLNVLYANLDYDLAVQLPVGPEGRVKVEDADDVDIGWRLSMLAEPTETTRFGVTYQSKVEPKLEGSVKPRNTPPNFDDDIKTKIPLVEAIHGGVYHRLNDQFAVMGSVSWENWSTFGSQPIQLGAINAAIPRRWHDTWGVSAGVHYYLDDKWMFQTGVRYDSTPVRNKDRTADLPLDQQVRWALGAQYQLSDSLNLGGAITYAWYGKGKIRSSSLRGDYERNNVFFLTLNLGFSKLPWSGALRFGSPESKS